ncbi:MAG: NTP transferase domain-containing protein [Mycoplasmatales bacterium]|nr:NTP transferase domain-containing protein [Mycoplasmatales bacterium]
MFEINNAIILAAGFGSRMAPVTNKIPKPLVKVNGISMIESQIKALIKANITNITIVVGKMAEKFEFLKEKYNVELLFNDMWDKANNIYTLQKASHLLGDTIVIEGDQLIYDENIIKKVNSEPHFLGKKEVEPTEEYVFDIENGKITGYHKGDSQGISIVNILYLNKEVSLEYAARLNEAVRYEENHQLYSEQILWTIKPHPISVHIIKNEAIIELDTFEELCSIDKSYKNFKY